MKDYIICSPSGEIIELEQKTKTLIANRKMLRYEPSYESWLLQDKFSNLAKDIIKFIEKYGAKDIKVNNKGEIKLFGNISLSYMKLEKFDWDLKIDNLEGSFNCTGNNLKNLKGSPRIISEDFDCSDNQLQNLDNGPEKVNGNYLCMNNQLRTLLGAPKEIYGDFDCSNNDLTNINYIPTIYGNIYLTSNYIKDLSPIGDVYGDLDISFNDFENLDSLPFIYGDLFCHGYVIKPNEMENINKKVKGKIITNK